MGEETTPRVKNAVSGARRGSSNCTGEDAGVRRGWPTMEGKRRSTAVSRPQAETDGNLPAAAVVLGRRGMAVYATATAARNCNNRHGHWLPYCGQDHGLSELQPWAWATRIMLKDHGYLGAVKVRKKQKRCNYSPA
uniref:Uncharacterized protein n=1 Tax=Arundo donax TaxID=35708 RepID=A0A0A9AFD5_ARUDO